MVRQKKYVSVIAKHTQYGEVKPMTIITPDGRMFEIETLKHICRCASNQVFGFGIRYTVVVGGHETYLFDEENGRWFVEAKQYDKTF